MPVNPDFYRSVLKDYWKCPLCGVMNHKDEHECANCGKLKPLPPIEISAWRDRD